MGQKSSKANQKKSNSGKMITKLSAQGGFGSSTTGTGYSYLTVKPAEYDEDLSVGAIEEGFVIPRRTENICGVFLETLVIASPMDDPMPRDMAIFHLFNYDSPEENMLAYIARPEVPKREAKESFAAMLDVLSKNQANVDQNQAKVDQNQAKVDQNQTEGCNFPALIVAGRIKRLYYGLDEFQQAEHDPEWRGRLVIIVSVPSNGVFISALLALSPEGRISTWLALVVGLGLVNALGALHKIGFIHRYVTPWNFMLPTPFNAKNIVNKTICMDLSLATKWTEKKKQGGPVQFVGTHKYSSKRAATRHNQGPADDFISVIFIVAELISGKLPWRSVKDLGESTALKQDFGRSHQFNRLPREIRHLYWQLYRTYGLKRADHDAVVGAFKSALQRINAEWKSDEQLPAFLSMPAEENNYC